MLGFELIRVAFHALTANKVRSLLTMLSVIIGVGSVVATMALGEGAAREIRDRLNELDLKQFELQVDWIQQRPGHWKMVGPTYDDYQALVADMTLAEFILPEINAEYSYEYRGRLERANTVGVPSYYYDMWDYQMAAGRFFSPLDGELRRRVLVLCADPAKAFAGDEPVSKLIGRTVRMNGQTYEIIGAAAPAGKRAGRNLDDDILMPIETMQHRIMGGDPERWSSAKLEMRIRTISQDQVMDAMAEAERIVRKSQHLRPDEPNHFRLYYKPLWVQMQGKVADTFSYLLISVAVISLIVGGVGVMNIMLVSVTERTREIGVRKALGARRTSILLQFLSEAVTLCLLGGAVGLAAGWGATKFLTAHYHWTMIVTPVSLVLAVGCAILVGIVSGTYPAIRAAFRDPVEALRYE